MIDLSSRESGESRSRARRGPARARGACQGEGEGERRPRLGTGDPRRRWRSRFYSRTRSDEASADSRLGPADVGRCRRSRGRRPGKLSAIVAAGAELATGRRRIDSWLYKVALNLCYDRLRRRREIATAEPPVGTDPAPDPEATLLGREIGGRIDARPAGASTQTARSDCPGAFSRDCRQRCCTDNGDQRRSSGEPSRPWATRFATRFGGFAR